MRPLEQHTFTTIFGRSHSPPTIFFQPRIGIRQFPLVARLELAAQFVWFAATTAQLLAKSGASDSRLCAGLSGVSRARLRRLEMEVTAAARAVALAASLVPAIAVAGDEVVAPTPQGQRAGQVQQWSEPPECGESPRKVASRCGTAIALPRLAVAASGGQHQHLLHQLVMR